MERRAELKEAISAALREIDGDRSPLDLVGEVPLIEEAVDELVAERVGAARAQGLSWEAIAGRLGISRQAAHKRFVKRKRKKPARTGTKIELRVQTSKRKGG